MIERIRELLAKKPFEPFVIHTNWGKDFPVPAAEYAKMSPLGPAVWVWSVDPDGGGRSLYDIHISDVELTALQKA